MGLAWWWDPCSSQNPRLADSTSESSVWGGQFGGPQERMNIWEELKDLCCVQHSATWLSLWVACRRNWNLWWRALVSVKLKRVTRSDYLVLMLWVYPRLTAQAFSREGDKRNAAACGSPSVSVLQSGTGLCPVQDVLLSDLLLWLVEWELKVGHQRVLLPLSSPKS